MIIDGITDAAGTGLLDGLIEQADLNAQSNKAIAKAWVTFDGTGPSATIIDSYNVSSVTYNGPGSYTINFTTPMNDVNYAAFAHANIINDPYRAKASNKTVNSCDMQHANTAGGVVDNASLSFICFGS